MIRVGRDKISRETRSHIMSSIRSKNTKVEMLLRKALWNAGHRYRLYAKLPGRPDIIFNSRKVVIFVDGDFWHGHKFKKLLPKLKNKFWVDKIKRNMERDKEVKRQLKRQGWDVIRIWEHQIRQNPQSCINLIQSRISEERK